MNTKPMYVEYIIKFGTLNNKRGAYLVQANNEQQARKIAEKELFVKYPQALWIKVMGAYDN